MCKQQWMEKVEVDGRGEGDGVIFYMPFNGLSTTE